MTYVSKEPVILEKAPASLWALGIWLAAHHSYNLTVNASPTEAGTVTGSGTYARLPLRHRTVIVCKALWLVFLESWG